MTDLPDRWCTDTQPCTLYPVWSRGNAGEVYPGPISPLAGGSVFFTAGERGYRDAFEIGGTLEPDEWDPSPNNLLASFGGYMYLNMSLARIYGVRAPGMTPDMVDQQYYGDLSEVPSYAEEARPTDESPANTAKLASWIEREIFGRTEIPELVEDRAAAEEFVSGRGDLTSYTHDALVARFRGQGELYRALFCRHILNSAAVGLGIGTVAGICEAVGRPELAMTLIATAGDVESAAPSLAMWDLGRKVRASPELTAAFDDGVEGILGRLAGSDSDDARRFRADVGDLLEAYGSRGPNEWELASEVWGTRPEIALVAVDRMRHQPDDDSPATHAGALRREREEAVAEVRHLLGGADEATCAQFEAGVRVAQLFAAARERSKTTCILVVHELRLVAREIGRRGVEAGALDHPGQVFMLSGHQLDDFAVDPHSFTDMVRTREAQYELLHQLEPPFFVVGEPPPLPDWPRRDAAVVEPVTAGEVLRGIPGCSGTHRGRARVVLDAADPRGLEPGDVLVAPVTDPAWTPLFVPAGAVVVDVGAQITHAVIVSRELAIPCVVSVTGASKRIPDGALVEVDGGAGTVTIVDVS